jgi:hypothetical protein
MPATSSYIQIADYALLEYIYESQPVSTSQARPLRIYNNYSNQYQFLNSTQATSLTANVLDFSAVRMGRESTKWAYLDMDTVTPVIQIDPNIKLLDLTSSLVPTINYDRVRLHFVSGFDFPGIDGVILEMKWNEWNINGTGGRIFTPAAQVYVKGEERIEFNTIPLFVGDRLYDRYIEFSIPSLADVNFDFWNSPTATNTFGYQYTFDNVGFSQESQISATLYEINSTSTERGNRYFITGENYTTSFNSSDLYSYINAVIQENPEFDYIEYYPTWNGQFLEDYINLLNAGGGDWVVVNQLELYEQLGTTFVKTFSMTSLQDTAFNAPAAYRPIVRNASLALSYTVEYTMRLLNKVNGQEIIRKATYTSTDPKKYGPVLQKINVLEGFRPVRVYNKIVNTSSDTIQASVQYIGTPTVMTQNVYVNSYYDVNYISVDSTTDISTVLGETVYPQGMNTIFINKFDNYVKFKIFTKSADRKQNVSLDLASTGMNVKLAFIFDDQSKIYIDPTQDMNAADPGAGEVMFRLDDTVTTKLLGGKQREYYIVNKNDKGDEVLIYAGKFADQKDRAKIMSEESSTALSQLDQKITTLKNLQTNLTSVQGAVTSTVAADVNAATATSSTSNTALAESEAEKISQSQADQSTVTSNAAGIKDAIQQAANSGQIKNLNIPDIPGVTPFVGANINNALTPKVIKPSSPGTKVTPQDVSTSALTKKTRK